MSKHTKKNKEKLKDFVKIIGLGPLQLELVLLLTKQQSEQFKIKLSEINSIEDCKSFLQNEKTILDLIGIKSSNVAINSLLYLNKVTKRKSFVEYLLLSQPVYEFPFMSSIVQHVTEQNYFFLLENNFFPFPTRISFSIKVLGEKDVPIETKSFDLCPNIKTPLPEFLTETNLHDRFNCDLGTADYFLIDLNDIIKLNCAVSSMTIVHFFKSLIESNKNLRIITIMPDTLDISNQMIEEFMFITDIFVMERKGTLAMIEQIDNVKEEYKSHHKKNDELYFIKEIRNRINRSKTGIIIDNLKTVTIIHQLPGTKIVSYHSSFELDFFPSNISEGLYNDYMKLTNVNYKELKSIFLGGFISELIYDRSFICCIRMGEEILKRAIEIFRFGMEFPLDEDFYEISKQMEEKEKDKSKDKLPNKEKNFILDCINIQTSKLKEYNSFYDKNLAKHFSSKNVRNHLRKVGFINGDSNILLDPDNKMFSITTDRKLIQNYEIESRKLDEIKEYNENIKFQIKGLCPNFPLGKINSQRNKLPSITKTFTRLYSNDSNDNQKHKTRSKMKLIPLDKKNYLRVLSQYENKLKSDMC